MFYQYIYLSKLMQAFEGKKSVNVSYLKVSIRTWDMYVYQIINWIAIYELKPERWQLEGYLKGISQEC
jgi:hypothetical protein